MKLSELLIFEPIIVQCHDNPDADAIASAYALYAYFKSNNKQVRLVYSGRNRIQKSNLKLLIDYLEIDELLEYVNDVEEFLSTCDRCEDGSFNGLLVTADCQYGAGNVTKIPARYVAIIDHHQREIKDVELSEIMSELGSCSTLVWKLLKDERIELNDIKLTTALYFGLYTDTNSLSEIANPFDKDMRDLIPYEKSVIQLLRNCNFSLSEFEIAGNAMNRYVYDEKYKFAIIQSEQCDPNILGLISDFLLQVAEIDICVVYNEWQAGYKFSVRSCVKEVHADDVAGFVAEEIGSGGGHLTKAGGFIRAAAYEEKYGELERDEFFKLRLMEYFDSCEIIYAKDYEAKLDGMKKYLKKRVPTGYVVAKDVLEVGTPITIRTLEGDIDMMVEDDLILKIGIQGEVYPGKTDKFYKSYDLTEVKYKDEESMKKPIYLPTVHNRLDGSVVELTDYAKICYSNGDTYIYAMSMKKRMKVFTMWDEEKYYYGKIGDYLAVRCDDLHDVYVIDKQIFAETYDEIE